eukprot:CAMPEP_0171118472 /NCGR_PEP_ID=MMETSP0766_2-20121228/94825_1 /TAXON_ID=439317 /ORGANISM="Gambierdiscus australes, Strain CAWD 149" /LENGTH=62 /DNA_ID=CAMNT_0011581055 /DNA_START=517 /DNA_END=703 /DNA_ORIENTATION=-
MTSHLLCATPGPEISRAGLALMGEAPMAAWFQLQPSNTQLGLVALLAVLAATTQSPTTPQVA